MTTVLHWVSYSLEKPYSAFPSYRNKTDAVVGTTASVFRRPLLNVSHLHVKNKVTVIHELFFLCGIAIFLLNSLKLFMAFRLTLKALLARGFLEREEVTQHR